MNTLGLPSRPVRFHIERSDRWPRPPVWALALVALWAALIVTFNIVNERTTGGALSACVIKTTTGIPCPTCGSTRMADHLMHGRFADGFLQNPFMLLLIAAGAVWIIARVALRRRIFLTIHPRARYAFWFALAAIFLANWAYVIVIDGQWARSF